MSAAISLETLEMVRACMPAIRWPDPMDLSEWADANAYIPAESNAEPGRWRTLPYQRGILDAMTDPKIEMVSIMKSARVGYTSMIGHLIGYHIAHDPCPIMLVQPTIDMAEDYSKEDFDGMVRNTPCLAGLVSDEAGRKRKSTLAYKKFPGGSLRFIGSNSPTGFRKVTTRILVFDEADAYPVEAGAEGDPISLGIKRTETFWNRHIVAGSTPTTDALSRIQIMFESGDQRRYHVPCPLCGHMHVYDFKRLKWPEGRPRAAYFVCPSCEGIITHDKKVWMVERGEWIAAKPFEGHASFHIWTAYSFAANATWGHIASEFVAAEKAGPRVLKTFVNTYLGETWKDSTEAPDWNPLYARREPYARGAVPARARVVTAGVDVQKDRLEVEIVAWGPGLESWPLDYLILEGDTANIDGPSWRELDKLLARQFECESGLTMPISKMGIDASYDTQHVWNWCRHHGVGGRVIPIKGVHNQSQIIRTPRVTDIRASGKRKKSGARLWFVGVSHIKRELYGWYRLPVPSETNPVAGIGYCHFGEFLDEHYFRMLTSENLVRTYKNGRTIEEWVLPSGRRNEALDCRVYNRAMAYLCGVDNMQREATVDSVPPSVGAMLEQPLPPVRENSLAPGQRKRRRSTFW